MGTFRDICKKRVRGNKEVPLHPGWAKGRQPKPTACTSTNPRWHGCPRRHRRTHREGTHCRTKDEKEPLTMARDVDGAAEGWTRGASASKLRHRMDGLFRVPGPRRNDAKMGNAQPQDTAPTRCPVPPSPWNRGWWPHMATGEGSNR